MIKDFPERSRKDSVSYNVLYLQKNYLNIENAFYIIYIYIYDKERLTLKQKGNII